MSYHRYKHTKLRSNLIPKSDAEASRLPEQVADFISQADTRFDEVARLYLEGLTIMDLQFMQSEDLINIVPPEQYRHRLLMSILVRRYLFRDDDEDCIPDFIQPLKDTVNSECHSYSSYSRNRKKCHNNTSDYCCSDCSSR